MDTWQLLVRHVDVWTPTKPPLSGSSLRENGHPDRPADGCGTALDGKLGRDSSVWTITGGLRVGFGDAINHVLRNNKVEVKRRSYTGQAN